VVGQQFTYVMTDRDRLVLGMFGGYASDALAFGPASKPQIRDTGAYGDREMIGPTGRSERSKILAIGPVGQPPFRIIVPESCAPPIIEWARL
jgi:hypothetical protein